MNFKIITHDNQNVLLSASEYCTLVWRTKYFRFFVMFTTSSVFSKIKQIDAFSSYENAEHAGVAPQRSQHSESFDTELDVIGVDPVAKDVLVLRW